MNEYKFDLPANPPDCRPDPVEKYPKARALAAAFWLSYFTLHWLLILEIVEISVRVGIALVLHFVLAALLSINIAAHEEKK